MNYLLIGRPNAGKSSLYNLLSERTFNIVHKEEGTTRDWHKDLIKGTDSYLFDTPGILINQKKLNFFETFLNEIFKHNINYFIYVIEYKNGFNQVDNFSINRLRKYNKNIILVVNKFDNYKEKPSNEFIQYGIESIFFISCSHNFGLDKLKSIFSLKKISNHPFNNNHLSIAIFGKPNAGKSTFLNTLVEYNRSKTSPIAGTTSDFVIDYIKYKNRNIKFIDTAGIGRKSNIKDKSISYYSIKKSFENLNNVDFSFILIDSKMGLDKQDKRIIKLISNKSKGVLLIFNKIDLIDDKLKFQSNMIIDMGNSLSEIKNIKFFFISALQKKSKSIILDYIFDHHFSINYKISTSKLNQWLKKITREKQHPLIDGKQVNFKYAVQIKETPVTIKIFCSYSSRLKNNYKKYLINNFNYKFKILNQKTKIIFSSSKNPYI